MNLYVGTSGYSYKEWKGRFYPKDLSAEQMLSYYGARFRSVEINNTFYRMPKAPVLKNWGEQVAADFKFALKAPRWLTYIRESADAGNRMAQFLKVAQALKKRLGPLLFQLPPTAKKDLTRLRAFLALLPTKQRVAFEFRHSTWFDDEVFALLRARRAALCIADAGDDLKVPFVATTDWGYLRLRRPDYRPAALKTWVTRVREQDWQDAFVFFKHEDEAKGPRLAQRFIELAV